MKTQLALPTGIKKLTNIAVVRLKKHGVRFEIACYKNTVGAWRDGFEKDIDNVLQTTQIYNNVSKGIFAKEEDLLKAFGSADEKVVAKLILETGEVQVSDKERKNTFDNIFRDAVNVLVDKCVNPETNRPYPPGMIERALREVHFQVDPTKSAKQQALAALPRLQEVFPIKRAAMRFRLTVPAERAQATLDMLLGENATIEEQTESAIVCTADPSVYRTLDKFAKDTSVQLEVVTMAVMEGGVSETFGETRGAERVSGSGDVNADGRGNVGAYAMRDLEGALAGAVPGGDGEAKMARAKIVARRDAAVGAEGSAGDSCVEVLYPRGPIAGLPDEHASRRDRFAPIDEIQGGWRVELRRRGGSSVVDAVFFSPDGVLHKSFADARREAMRAKREGA